jgi:protein-S-isoprenylcysteine O-methyltransferase Ste14
MGYGFSWLRMERFTDFIIVGCWIFFFGYWLVSALHGKKIVERQSIASALAHRIPVGIGWFLLLFRGLGTPLDNRVIPRTDLTLVAGTTVCVLGLLVTIWARRTLAGNWSSDVTFKQDHELVRAGPYRFVRHPIYTGLLVMALGTAIEIGRLRCWIGLAVVGVGFWIKLKQEERLLRRHFPDEYPVYERQVKALVPWVV